MGRQGPATVSGLGPSEAAKAPRSVTYRVWGGRTQGGGWPACLPCQAPGSGTQLGSSDDSGVENKGGIGFVLHFFMCVPSPAVKSIGQVPL
jgi:hypothetical protein